MYQIAHVVDIVNVSSNGISDVVPQYVKHQNQYEKVVLINVAKRVKPECFKNTDLFILHGMYNLKVFNFYRKYVKNRYKYIVVPHGGLNEISQKKSYFKKAFVNHTLFYSYFKRAAAIQYLCNYEKEHSINVHNLRGIICSNGIEIKEINEYAKHITDVDKLSLVYIGRLNMYHKGIDILVEACRCISHLLRKSHVHIDLIGVCRDGSNIEIEKRIKKYELEDIINFDISGVFGEEKQRKLLEADYFIQTSRLEGLPLGILEAMSNGIPLLVTKPVGIEEIINEYKCGFCSEASVFGVIELLKKAIKNKEMLFDMSKNAYDASKRFSWDSVTVETLRNYRRVIRGKK